MLIKEIYVDGPDCSGKTTLINHIHEKTSYTHHIFDRSRISQFIFNDMYNRDIKESKLLLDKELNDLNKLFIILLPDKFVVAERFLDRGDELHDIESISTVYNRFEEFSKSIASRPNVKVINAKYPLDTALEAIDVYSSMSVPVVVSSYVSTLVPMESISITTTEIGLAEDLWYDDNVMKFTKEAEYYERISNEFLNKIKDELNGNNEYSKQQTSNSRRFIFTDDSCISCFHAILRNKTLHMNAYIRSSNVIQLDYDYAFIKNLAVIVRGALETAFHSTTIIDYCLDVKFGSAHIIEEKHVP